MKFSFNIKYNTVLGWSFYRVNEHAYLSNFDLSLLKENALFVSSVF